MKQRELTKREIGEIFEEHAAEFYRQKGYSVLFHSYRYQQYEIDLIVKKKDVVVFVEVKSGNAKNGFDPIDRVDNEKMRKIDLCAEGFKKMLKQKKIAVEEFSFRYDAVGILYDDEMNLLQIERQKDYYRPNPHKMG